MKTMFKGALIVLVCLSGLIGCSTEKLGVCNTRPQSAAKPSIRDGYGVICGMTYCQLTGVQNGRWPSPHDHKGMTNHLITVVSASGEEVSKHVDEQGRFAFEVLPGEYNVVGPAEILNRLKGKNSAETKRVTVEKGQSVVCDFMVDLAYVD